MTGISLKGVGKSFGATEVIKGIDLEIEQAEFVELVGPSGCGKSTLLNLIAGLETSSAGDILIGGRKVNDVPPRDRDIAMVFLFDEPLSNLDAKLRIVMRAEIKKRHQRLGKTLVHVTQDQIEAMTLALRIAVLDEGHMRQVADPTTIYEDPVDLFVAGFMGSPPMNLLPGRLVREGGMVVLCGEGTTQVRFPLSDRIASRVAGSERRAIVLGLRPETIFAAGTQLSGANRFVFERAVVVDEPTGPDTMTVT